MDGHGVRDEMEDGDGGRAGGGRARRGMEASTRTHVHMEVRSSLHAFPKIFRRVGPSLERPAAAA
eukprot:3652589-Alexandrium_andersonii.AAC.1